MTTGDPLLSGIAGDGSALTGISRITISTTQVFNGAMPTSWTDLDLSSVVGSKQVLVGLKVTNNEETNDIEPVFRMNGDTADYLTTTTETGGIEIARMDAGKSATLIVRTDDNGVVEWQDASGLARSCTVYVVWYIEE